MANLNTPFGFKHFGYLEGFDPSYGMTARRIASGNGTAIFRGDAVTSLNTGYIAQSSPGTTQIAGIFQGCEYLSVALKTKVRSPYWPGSDANGDVTAFIIDNPYATFLVQASGAFFNLTSVGNNVQIVVGTGNTTTGYSGMTLDCANAPGGANTATFPFRIIRLASAVLPAGSNGSDNTTNFNQLIVTFNNQDYRSLTGI